MMILMIIWLIVYVSAIHAAEEAGQLDKILRPGYCKGLWRPENLPGKCFGLRPHGDYDEAKHIPVVHSSKECRALCCNLGDKCISWQYHAATKVCRFGMIVRLGLEATGTSDWCDPSPPAQWNGNRLVSRVGGQCIWGETIPTQCFGFGPERLKNDKPLNTEQCAAACCEDKDCGMWQEIPGRGCYFSRKEGIFCAASIEEPYEGGRKCVPGYCGGLEEQILGAYNKTKI
jgi:hypothetical protein